MADMPERIWAGSCEALGAPDTGYWYPVRTPSTPTEFVSASTHTRAMEALPDLSHVILWLESGCDPAKAAAELRIYKARIDAILKEDTNAEEPPRVNTDICVLTPEGTAAVTITKEPTNAE